jgi:hypothetical protein
VAAGGAEGQVDRGQPGERRGSIARAAGGGGAEPPPGYAVTRAAGAAAGGRQSLGHGVCQR